MLYSVSRELRRFVSIISQRPQAMAVISGSNEYPDIKGTISFFQIEHGVIVLADISGLPTPDEECKSPIFAFHIHEGDSCTGNVDDPFAQALSHYNPGNCPHPYHAGDLPPLFGNNGYAFEVFLTDRFAVNEIIGRTVIIHEHPDDFTTQPSGNSGTKIACGEIYS